MIVTFNLAPFNLQPYNRAVVVEALMSVTFETSVDMKSRLSAEMTLSATISTATEVVSNYIREIPFSTTIDVSTEFISRLNSDMLLKANFEPRTELSVEIDYLHIDGITFTGEFKPGDKLIIDTKKMTVTLNGQNALHLVTGDFFDLILGTNKITYSDTEGTRNVLTRITHRDKFLY